MVRRKVDLSYGIVPLKFQDGLWHVFLICHQAGHWSFPKGHADAGELPMDAAVRELKEESGLDVCSFVEMEPVHEQYSFFHEGVRIDKTVTYYLATVEGDVKLQEDEVSDYKWVPLLEAADHVTFEQARQICDYIAQNASPELFDQEL